MADFSIESGLSRLEHATAAGLGLAMLACAVALPVWGQSTPATPNPDHVAMGVAAERALAPEAALHHYKAAIAADSSNYEANWRAAMTLIDLGQQTSIPVPSARRDSLYAAAEGYARRAVAIDSSRADGHFALAVAIGYGALAKKKKKEKVRRATEVRSAALQALAIDSLHDGALHVLGRWNAEVMRLSGLSRLLAKTFLGGGVLGEASWQAAVDDLERATRLAPKRIYHHLDLARVYVDRKRYADARTQLQKVDSLPAIYFMDAAYKKDAAALLQKIAGK